MARSSGRPWRAKNASDTLQFTAFFFPVKAFASRGPFMRFFGGFFLFGLVLDFGITSLIDHFVLLGVRL